MQEQLSDNPESVALLYDWLPRLYEAAERRYVAADNRIQWVLGFSVTLFVGVGAFLKVSDAAFAMNVPFFLALVVLAAQVVFGLISLAAGGIRSFGLNSIVSNGLNMSSHEFRRDALDWADSDIYETTKSINSKARSVWILVLGFVFESSTLFWWITTLSTKSPSAP